MRLHEVELLTHAWSKLTHPLSYTSERFTLKREREREVGAAVRLGYARFIILVLRKPYHPSVSKWADKRTNRCV